MYGRARWFRIGVRVALAIAAGSFVGCATPIATGRIGQRVSLPTGDPVATCEQREWYELVPAQVEVSGAVASGTVVTSYRAAAQGLGVFERGEDEPEQTEDVLEQMQEPELAAAHQARIQPVDDALYKTLHWSLGGTAGLLGGLTVAALIQEDSPEAAAVFGIGGLVFGVVAVVVALASQPSGVDQMEADARRQLFFADEDDLLAVMRGVNRMNGIRRQRCGGPPPQPWIPSERDLHREVAPSSTPPATTPPATTPPPPLPTSSTQLSLR